ncbi:hypothetical protein [Limnohabitans sp.]
MGSGIGLAWWHHSKLYTKQFNEPAPQWVYEIEIGKRLRLIKLAMQLAWRLPAEVLPDDVPEDKPDSKHK